jgi:ATP-dependent RNA helicase RhlE
MKFSDFGLADGVMEGLDAMGFEKPTPIQEQAIPLAIAGKDVIGVAQTGTGKTAAFLLPVMSKISQSPDNNINALIIVPTRELALQIDQAIQGFGYFAGVSSMAIYGGGDGAEFNAEKKALMTGADIVVATPGRLLSHLSLGYADFSKIDFLILDEADRMLDMGFYADIMRIVKHCNVERQSLLFSATMPPDILKLTRSILKNPSEINIAVSKPAEGVMQCAYSVFNKQKVPLLAHLLRGKDLQSVIVFSSTKRMVAEIARSLQRQKFNCDAISSDLEQDDREKVMLGFRNRTIQILVATDVVSRGIDIEDIDLVVNFDVPGDAEDYVHRVGRTARASKTGIAITLINPEDQGKFAKIEKLIEMEIRKLGVPEQFGESPAYNPNAGNRSREKRPFHGKKRPNKSAKR